MRTADSYVASSRVLRDWVFPLRHGVAALPSRVSSWDLVKSFNTARIVSCSSGSTHVLPDAAGGPAVVNSLVPVSLPGSPDSLPAMAAPQMKPQLLHIPISADELMERALWQKKLLPTAVASPASERPSRSPPAQAQVQLVTPSTPLNLPAPPPAVLVRQQRCVVQPPGVWLTAAVNRNIFLAPDSNFAILEVEVKDRYTPTEQPLRAVEHSPGTSFAGQFPPVRVTRRRHRLQHRDAPASQQAVRDAQPRTPAFPNPLLTRLIVAKGNQLKGAAQAHGGNSSQLLFLAGDWETHASYGIQLVVKTWSPDTPDARQGLQTLLCGCMPESVAAGLVAACGLGAPFLLDRPDAARSLAQLSLPDLTHDKCQQIKEAWDSMRRSGSSTQAPARHHHARPIHDMEDQLGLDPVNLVQLKTAFMNLKPAAQALQPRTSISLSVTDLTSAQWCGLQLAYQTATGERKQQTAQMAQGGQIHEQLELEVVNKVEVAPESPEDEMAIQLLNAVAAIRQLVVEGKTRELRVFAKLRDQWIVGVIDGLDFDHQAGTVSLGETKTRKKRSVPPPEQQDSAKLQVMVYHQLYSSFRRLTSPEIMTYLFDSSTSGVGLDPRKPLGAGLVQHCRGVFPGRVGTTPVPHTSSTSTHLQPPVAVLSPHVVNGHSSQPPSHSPSPSPGLAYPPPPPTTTNVIAPQQHSNGSSAAVQGVAASQPQRQSPAPSQSPASPGIGVLGKLGLGSPAVVYPAAVHVAGTPGRRRGTVLRTADPAAAAACPSPVQPPLPATPQQQQQAARLPVRVIEGSGGNDQRQPPLTLLDCVQLLADSLEWLPPVGTQHSLEYLWQEDPSVVIKREVVPYDESWCAPRLTAALDTWQGKVPPKPVSFNEQWKCKFCDFRSSCRVYEPQHPLSDPHKLAASCLEQKKEAAAAARKNGGSIK